MTFFIHRHSRFGRYKMLSTNININENLINFNYEFYEAIINKKKFKNISITNNDIKSFKMASICIIGLSNIIKFLVIFMAIMSIHCLSFVYPIMTSSSFLIDLFLMDLFLIVISFLFSFIITLKYGVKIYLNNGQKIYVPIYDTIFHSYKSNKNLIDTLKSLEEK